MSIKILNNRAEVGSVPEKQTILTTDSKEKSIQLHSHTSLDDALIHADDSTFNKSDLSSRKTSKNEATKPFSLFSSLAAKQLSSTQTTGVLSKQEVLLNQARALARLLPTDMSDKDLKHALVIPNPWNPITQPPSIPNENLNEFYMQYRTLFSELSLHNLDKLIPSIPEIIINAYNSR